MSLRQDEGAGPPKASLWHLLRAPLQIMIALAIVAAALYLAKDFRDSRPQARRRPPGPRVATLVEVLPVESGPQQIVIEASGSVVPARVVALHPRVQGEVVSLHDQLEPGGLVSEGDVILRIDDDDYELAARQAQANLSTAEASVRIEEGNQQIARREFELYGGEYDDSDSDLMLRQPQLDSAAAAVEAADAALDQAQLSLRRTRVRAPFDAVVDSLSVNIGSPVTPATELAVLVGTDAFWIEAAVPVDQLRWIDIPGRGSQTGSPVTVRLTSAWGRDAARQGRVIRLEPSLEEGGRLARLLIEVDDPMALTAENGDRPALFLDAWAELEIAGRRLEDVIVLDRRWVRDGDVVWVMDEENRLEIRPIEITFRRRDEVIVVDGLTAGERIVTTPLPAPVEGMPLRTGDEPAGDDRGPGDRARRPANAEGGSGDGPRRGGGSGGASRGEGRLP